MGLSRMDSGLQEAQPQLPQEDYFNDLSQQLPDPDTTAVPEAHLPKAKRIACVLCRKRKLKCDGTKPSCATCTRLAHDCSYDETRKKSGPKRGYVKALEARLAQVETLLKTGDSTDTSKSNEPPKVYRTDSADSVEALDYSGLNGADMDLGEYDIDVDLGSIVKDRANAEAFALPFPNAAFSNNAAGTGMAEEPITWEMIGLGLEEPLPHSDVINELNQLYFSKVHPIYPMIHRARFMAKMDLGPQARPPVCLRYAMWATAASVTDKYDSLAEPFYLRARKYLERDEMRGMGEGLGTVAHTQAWFLVAMWEFKMTYFPRAWMSSGRACRLATMLGLHRLDGKGLDVKQCLPPPRNWSEHEEWRRTFWMCFTLDRSASMGTGWPMTLVEADILTNLPAGDEAFENDLQQLAPSVSLEEALSPGSEFNLSPTAAIVVLTCIFGRNLLHLHRPSPNDDPSNLNGGFWRRHRVIDDILLNTSLALPSHLRLPNGVGDPNVVFLNMCIHTATICLHQAAIFKADAHRMTAKVSAESKIRCITSASEIVSIMRMISHQDLSTMCPFITFCLYVGARVFVQCLKSKPHDHQMKASLSFAMSAMHALKKRNPITEAFLVQLDVDLEAAGLEEARKLRSRLARIPTSDRIAVAGCGPIAGAHPSMGGPQTASVLMHKKPGHGTCANNGPAVHSAPGHTSLGQERVKAFPAWTASSNAQGTENGMSYLYGGTAQAGHEFSIGISIPMRQRTPVSGPSTQASPETMDISTDTNNDSTPSSLQNISSHVSNTSYTPPSQYQDDQPHQWTSQMFETANPTVHILSQEQQPDMKFGGVSHANGSDFQSRFDNSHTAPFAGPETHPFPSHFSPSQSWSMSGTGLTPGATTSFESTGTGFTPGAMNDLSNLTEAEWKLMLNDGGMLDDLGLGWESGMPPHASAGPHETYE